MSTLNTLLESTSGWQSAQTDAAKLANRWEKSGLLEGLEDTHRNTMAVLLENQAKQLVVEANTTAGTSDFTNGTGAQWAGIALPMVRKVFGQIAAKEFVSVQPMSLPAGLVFYLDYQYGTTKSAPGAGQSSTNSLYGTPSANFGNLAEGGLYGAGRFGYSVNQFTSSVVAASSIASASFAEVDFDANFSSSIQGGTDSALTNVHKLVFATSSLPNLDVNGISAFTVVSASGATVTAAETLGQFTKINGGNIEFFVTTSALMGPAADSEYNIYFNKQDTIRYRGDFEDQNPFALEGNANSSTQIPIPEINIQLRNETISAKTRKLKAQWTPEFAQDLNAYQNVDAEAELTSILSEYISMEIDLEILGMLIENAATTDYWSAKVGNQINSTSTAFDANTAGVYYTQMSWFQTIGIKLQKLSNTIHQRTLRGGANFMVCSPAVATILESIPGFAADASADADAMKYAFGVQKIGALNSRYKVYKNPYMTENVILLGFRGTQFLEAGAVYAPYIPLIMTPLVYNPDTFTPNKGIMTRYAKKMIRPEFYANLFVSDLNIV
jgi:hypothetical protein